MGRALAARVRAGPSPAGIEDRTLKAVGLALILPGAGVLFYAIDRVASLPSIALADILTAAAAGIVAANVAAAGGIVLRAGFGSAPLVRDRRRRRALALQAAAANVAAPPLLWTLLTDDPQIGARIEAAGWEGWPDVAAAALGFAAWRLWRRSRRHESISADEAMALDPRPPVLYLRSFRDDGETFVDDAAGPGAWLLRVSRMGSAEEKMTPILARVGPVIAIGKPGEPLPELGAARLYVAHADWQRRVVELMQQAALVVVRVGSSAGVVWEIDQALAHVPRTRLVLAILGTEAVAPDVLARLVPAVGASIDAALPEASRRTWRTLLGGRSARRIGGLIYFDESGAARAVAVQRQRLSRWNVRQLLDSLTIHGSVRRAWNEVLLRTGLAQPEPVQRKSRGLAVLLAFLLGAFGAHWFYLGHRRRGYVYLATIPLLLAPMFVAFVDGIRFVLADGEEFQGKVEKWRSGEVEKWRSGEVSGKWKVGSDK